MNMIHSDAPAVWVLIFDRQLPECEFDRLDVEGTCFEQFLLQDVRSDISDDEVFGGQPVFLKLANAMTALGQNASLVNIMTTDATSTSTIAHDDRQGMESSMRRSHMPLSGVYELDCRNFCNIENATRESATIEKAFSANLVWIEANVAAATQPATTAAAILEFIYDRLASCSGPEQKCPVLLMTFRRGENFRVSEPLKSGVPENLMHVPLWIRPNSGHACRVQALTGSFDLLPTIATFLGSSDATDEISPPDVAQIADLSDREVASTVLTTEPRSLAFLCGAPQVCTNRVLKLQGDGWTGARTEEFLHVISDNSKSNASQTESDGDSSEEPSRRLYVKPDDRFNVNDVSRTYATVTEELSGILQNLDQTIC
jgi:hypothetical protein